MDVKSPFPGMDPYLEAPDIWPDFHERLATTISAVLNTELPAPYYAQLQKRPELGVMLEAGTKRWIVPDVVVVRYPQRAPVRPSEAGVAVLDAPRPMVAEGIQVRVHTDPLQHHYPVDVREPLPCIPVPLAGEDPDVPLDLQIAAQRAYREGPYLRAIDYAQPPDPPLSEEDAPWADARLRAAGLRGNCRKRSSLA